MYQDLETEYATNIDHHQAIHRLSPEFQVTAVSEDGLIEGIYMPAHKFVLGIQWHPEFSYEKDNDSKSLIRNFISETDKTMVEYPY